MPTKQKIIKEGLEEIREENRLVNQKRIERDSDFTQKMLSLPEGRGPFYTNRAQRRQMMRTLRKLRGIPARPKLEKMEIPSG